MTSIKDLETQIESAEDALAFVKDELQELKTNLQELKAQEKDKQPEPASLLGRWATHPTYGRGIITDVEPSADGDVEFAFPDAGDCETRTSSIQVTLDEIDLDPETLITAKDFEDAPEGTIAEAAMYPKDVAVKTEDGWYRAGGMHAIAVEYMPTCRVIRWGDGK